MTDTAQFEQSLAQLQHIVEQMEHGSLSLEASLAAFERGIQLTRHCQKALQDAEQKVMILTGRDGSDGLVRFDQDARRS